MPCVVAAPSKLQRPSGDRVRTDAKDALHLARLLRLGEITPVAVPSLEQEAARDLVRARQDSRGDLMRARHRLSKAERWARVPDRGAATEPARRGLRARFEREVDPDGILPVQEVARRADQLMHAHMMRMSRAAASARHRRHRQ